MAEPGFTPGLPDSIPAFPHSTPLPPSVTHTPNRYFLSASALLKTLLWALAVTGPSAFPAPEADVPGRADQHTHSSQKGYCQMERPGDGEPGVGERSLKNPVR